MLSTLLVLFLTQQTTPAWRYTSPDSIGAFQVTPFGTLAVQTGSSVLVLDLATGQPIWSRSDARRFDVIAGSPYGVLRTADATLELIDFETGVRRWSFANVALRWMSYIPMPERDLLLAYGHSDPTSFEVYAVELESGNVRWVVADLFAAPQLAEHRKDVHLMGENIHLTGGQAVLWDTDTTMVLYPSHGGPIKLDARSGRLYWRVDPLLTQRPPDPRDRHGELLAAGGRVFVPYGKRLLAVDGETGRVLWNHRKNNAGLIAQMELTRHGLLIRGRPARGGPASAAFLDLLDPATGASRWESALTSLDHATAFGLIGDTAFIAAEGRLWRVDLATGVKTEIAQLRFEGREKPSVLEAMPEGFLLVSSQNIALVDPSGRQQYHKYYPAVGASFLAQLASTVFIIGLNVASISTMQQTGGAILITRNPVLSARYRQSQLAESYHFLFTDQKDEADHEGFSFVRLEKLTGFERGRVWVTDRQPRYVLDPGSATLFVVVGKAELQALRF